MANTKTNFQQYVINIAQDYYKDYLHSAVSTAEEVVRVKYSKL